MLKLKSAHSLAAVACLLFCAGPAVVSAQDANATIAALVQHETAASEHRGHYVYTSEERSDRTGGHLWVERIGETAWGKIRYLQMEDGQPLTGDRLAAEKAKLSGEAADPEGFKRAESARVDDEMHAKQMLQLLPKAFVFEQPVTEGDLTRVSFRPNPDYQPASMEERVLHGMTGTVTIDSKTMRLRGLEGKMPEDVVIGFGFLATIHAGSNFRTVRQHIEGPDWKTETLHTDIKGKALFLKTVARQQDSRHYAFHKIDDGTTVAEAVTLVEQ